MLEKELKQIEKWIERDWAPEDEFNPGLVTIGKDENGAWIYPYIIVQNLVNEVRSLKFEKSELRDEIVDLEAHIKDLEKRAEKDW